MYVFSECDFEVNGFIAQTVAYFPFCVIVKTDDVCCCCRPDERVLLNLSQTKCTVPEIPLADTATFP